MKNEKTSSGGRRLFGKIMKWLLAIVLVVILLLIVVIALVQIPAVQTYITSQVVSTFSERTGTRMEVGQVEIRFPTNIGIEDIYVEDQQGDTLVYAGDIQVDVNLLGLLRSRINVTSISVEQLVANIEKNPPDTVYNFQFIVDSFASEPDTVQEEPTGEGMEISLGEINLEDIRVRFSDYQQGIDLRVDLGQLQTRVTQFNPDSMAYHLGQLQISNSLVEVQMSEPARQQEPPPEEESQPLDLMLEQLVLDDFAFRMQAADGPDMQVNIPRLQVDPRQIDMSRNLVHLDLISASDLVIAMQSPVAQQASEPQPAPQEEFSFRWAETFEWDILVQELDVAIAELSMTTTGSQPAAEGFDASNPELRNVELQANDIVVNPQAIGLELQNLSAAHPSGFRLQELSADISLEDNLQIDDFTLRTNRSNLQLSFFSDLNPLDFSSDDLQEMTIRLNVPRGQLATDLAFFYPPLEQMAGDIESLQVTTRLQGGLSDLDLDFFRIHIPDLLMASLENGVIRGLPETENVVVDLPQILVQARPQRIMAMMPDTLAAMPVTLPDTLSLEGQFSGGMQGFTADMAMNSSLGNIDLNAEYDDPAAAGATYRGQVEIQEIEAGRLLQQEEMLGSVTARLSFSGTDTDPATANGEFQLMVENATLNQYEYQQLELTGTLTEGLLEASLQYDDDNLVLEASPQVNFSQEDMNIQLSLNLDRANLQNLNFTEQLMIVRTQVSANMTLVEDFAEGELVVSGLRVREEDQVFSMEKFSVQTFLENDTYQVMVISPLLQAEYQGNFSPAGVPAALTDHLNRYFSMPLAEDTLNHEGKEFSLRLRVPPSEWLTDFLMPSLSFSEPIQVNTEFDYDSRNLSAGITAQQLALGNIALNDIEVTANTNTREGNFNVAVETFDMDNLNLTNVLFQAELQDDVIDFLVEFDDQNQELWLSLGGMLRSQQQAWELSLDTSLVINREEWRASPGNYVLFGDQRLLVNHLRLQNEQKYLLINSEDDSPQRSEGPPREHPAPPLNITFNDFQLHDFSVLEEEPLLGGLFNGYITLENVMSDFSFTADLSVEDFSFGGDTLGSIYVQAGNPQPDLFTVEASVLGQGNDIDVTGSYRTGQDPSLDLVLALNETNLNTLEGFLEGTVTDLSGDISGKMEVKGPPSDPAVNGNINFDQVDFQLVMANVGFTIPDETIRFDRNMVRFDAFTLVDEEKGEATLDGQVNLRDLPGVIFDLELTTDNFRLLDAPPGQNDLFSGFLLVDSDLSVTGDLVRPVVEGLVRLNEGSNFSFTIPQTEPDVVGAEGVVEFISYTDTLFQAQAGPADTLAAPEAFQNLDLSVNVEIDPETQLRIVIDEAAGDNLELTGGGVLSLGMDPGGNFSLTGRYEIRDGSYLLTFYNALRRNFDIQEGSTIQWRGDPMDALVDITAIYTVSTSARELLISQREEGSGESAALRQQYPFQVLLNMDGDLESPDISFGIQLPEEERNALDGRVQSRLNELSQTESELNKQVFALLVLGSFIQENPFAATGGGGGVEGAARSSASRILSQQLNRLSDRYVKGVDINFDVESYEDYTTGQAEGRTELEMEVSKDFLDERLRVTVGGNIELEDETGRQTSAGEIAGDFEVEYLLDPNGNLILKVFRNKNYGDLFEAEVFETGISLLYTRSYNYFRELFTPREDPYFVPDIEPETETDNED